MECPYCKQEMKQGYLKGDGRMRHLNFPAGIVKAVRS